jgi:nicotinate phosphoribosyltransferase
MNKVSLNQKAPEHELITSGFDYYKPTMSQLAFEQYPEAKTTFQLINRGKQRISDYVLPVDLQRRLDYRRQRGFDESELDYLGSLRDSKNQPIFQPVYLDYLKHHTLPPVQVGTDINSGDLTVTTTGDWPLTTFWETIVMSDLNEIYFENYLIAHNLSPTDFYDEGDRRLSQKIATLKGRPDIKFADFGTRRRFSLAWQKHVLERLSKECPNNLVGTSNVALARSLDLRPIGTYAHEMPMIYAGIAEAENRLGDKKQNPLLSHSRQMTDWLARYPDYDTALTDTFGSKLFLADFASQVDSWRGVRHDSGDPIDFGNRFIDFLFYRGIDPMTKTICFSDGLNMQEIVKLADYFRDRIGFNFGWGTTLTNDLGLLTLNIVMKPIAVEHRGQTVGTVKLSDVKGKHTGAPNDISSTLYNVQELLATAKELAPNYRDLREALVA